ncbi:mitochondrial metal transporter [Spiromyces aspiralis]|uniref:Mitochondrial metal transporter n=1 Tax=Spiromyces aspiralis TaxID=68401 RepID=A0ACC1HQV4_9FUNG|nr:mitochondrial metal transporter [Spiromyces aspiralis]
MKGFAGIHLHSASLLADAAHSFSDILGDIVTLYTFKKARKAPNRTHQFGYGRYEAMGTLVVSLFLLSAGVGVGLHSLQSFVHLLPESLNIFAATKSAVCHPAAPTVADTVHGLSALPPGTDAGHGHNHGLSGMLGIGSHSHGIPVVDGKVDPSALWFAATSVVVNEALFQAIRRGSWLTVTKFDVFSDEGRSAHPLGGLVVSAVLAKSGTSMTINALRELTDTLHRPEVQSRLEDADSRIVDISRIRDRKSGPFDNVDMVLVVTPDVRASEIDQITSGIRASLKQEFPNINDICIDVRTPEPRQQAGATIDSHESRP